MRLSEFEEDITTWDELEEFCRDYEVSDNLDNVYSRRQYKDLMHERIGDWIADDDDIHDIAGWLNDYPDTYGYERYIDYGGDWYGSNDSDSDFDEYKQKVMDCMGDDFWEPEEDDEYEDAAESFSEPQEEAIEVEDVSIDELMTNASELLREAI